MEDKKQFDELLGGRENLPHEVDTMKLVSARAGEIAVLTRAIRNPQQTKLVFQKLPVYMRRRVMSHNAKRLPRRLREAHLRQMTKSGLPPKSKRPSRKYRRRPSNLLIEYNRRQRQKVWLETHIWHAKRFHMIEKWGYKVANFANDKCFKANYRAVMKYCLMQDLSYYACIEISGPNEILQKCLGAHCNPTELSFNAKAYTTGKREGTLMFFRKNGYPKFPIGNVHFLWQPFESDTKRIWIWVHPAFYNDLLAEIVSSFEMQSDNEDTNVSGDVKSSVFSKYTNAQGCQILLLKNTMNRFRLYGPLTLNVLTDALRLVSLGDGKPCKKSVDQTKENLDTKMEVEEEIQEYSKDRNLPTTCNSWLLDYYNTQENIEIMKAQKSIWEMLQSIDSPNQLPPNIVLAFSVLDPRFYTPKKRTKCQRKEIPSNFIQLPTANVSESPIWDTDIRRKVSESCVPTREINKLRSSCLVPGVSNDAEFDEDIMSKIPILLIQKPGNSSSGFSSSIDIIFPAGWAMSFWISFILRCARVGALRESRSIAFESSNTRSPEVNDPDTPAYANEALLRKMELTRKYFRYPPNRRVNFTKLGITSPFYCQWGMLMREWTGSEDFYVLRDRRLLTLLQSTSRSKKRKKLDASGNNSEDLRDQFDETNCLIRVKISTARRGRPQDFALICLPTSDDLRRFNSDERWVGPVETPKNDPHQSRRRDLRRRHLKLLRRYRRQRIRYRRAAIAKASFEAKDESELIALRTKIRKSANSAREVVRSHAEKMEALYLPVCGSVRNSCEREVLGYVTDGDYSFAEARGVGIGYVALPPLLDLIAKRSDVVLVRNTRTRQYKVARLEVLSA